MTGRWGLVAGVVAGRICRVRGWERQRHGARLTIALGVALSIGLLWAAPAGAFVYWTNAGGTNTLGRASLDGSTPTSENFFPTTSSGDGAAADGHYIYWDSSTGIGRANLDGSNPNPSFIPDSSPSGVVVAGQYIYWAHNTNSNSPAGSIWRANLNGTGAQQIVGNISSGVTDALAVSGPYIYWTNFWSSAIGRANLDGSNPNYSLINNDHTGMGIAVDGQHIYWATEYDGTIARANLDGTGVNLTWIPGLDKGTSAQAISLAIDNQHIYWTNYASGRIGRANIDGTGINQGFVTGASSPQGLGLDAAPANVTPPTIVGIATSGATISEVHGTWAPNPTSYSYQWLRCDSGGNNCAAIAGATGQSYGVTAADAGSTLRVQEVASYGGTLSPPATSGAVAVPALPNPSPSPSPSPSPGSSPPPPPTAGLTGLSASDGIVTITLMCSGVSGQTCSETITGTVTEHKRGGVIIAVSARKGHKHSGKPQGTKKVTVTVASTSASIPAGQTATIRMPLNSTGARLLTPRGRMPVTVSFTGTLNTRRTVMVTRALSRLRVSTPPDSWYHINTPCSNCFTQAQNVPIRGLPAGAHVTVTCTGAGCPFRTRSVAPRHGQINLGSVLGGSHLQPGTKVKLVISAPGRIGVTIVYTMQRGSVPERNIK